MAFGHGGFAAICSLKAAANLLGPSSCSPQELKSPCFGDRRQGLGFFRNLQPKGRSQSGWAITLLAAGA
nr:hypothetical protein [Saprospira grandis]